MLALNALTLAFVLFHTLTWFNLAPHAMVVRLRGQRVPRTWIAGAPTWWWGAGHCRQQTVGQRERGLHVQSRL